MGKKQQQNNIENANGKLVDLKKLHFFSPPIFHLHFEKTA
jgi:hypothetical protein